MKIKFDSTQEYQKQAVSGLVDLFNGQNLKKGDYEVEINTATEKGQISIFQSELGIGNNKIGRAHV